MSLDMLLDTGCASVILGHSERRAGHAESNADVKLHVFAQSGRSIYTTTVRALTPGYHQLAWDGRDAEGAELANGVYFFRMIASTPSGGGTQQLGRLVKLRRPRRIEEPIVP